MKVSISYLLDTMTFGDAVVVGFTIGMMLTLAYTVFWL